MTKEAKRHRTYAIMSLDDAVSRVRAYIHDHATGEQAAGLVGVVTQLESIRERFERTTATTL